MPVKASLSNHGQGLGQVVKQLRAHCLNVLKDEAAALLLKLDGAMLLRHGGDLQDVFHLQVLAQEGRHCVPEAKYAYLGAYFGVPNMVKWGVPEKILQYAV